MKDELIINGKLYVHTPDVKEEKRRELYVVKHNCNTSNVSYHAYHYAPVAEHTRMIEIKENEIIVSEDDVRKAFHKAFPVSNQQSLNNLMDAFGFKKDGV